MLLGSNRPPNGQRRDLTSSTRFRVIILPHTYGEVVVGRNSTVSQFCEFVFRSVKDRLSAKYGAGFSYFSPKKMMIYVSARDCLAECRRRLSHSMRQYVLLRLRFPFLIESDRRCTEFKVSNKLPADGGANQFRTTCLSIESAHWVLGSILLCATTITSDCCCGQIVAVFELARHGTEPVWLVSNGNGLWTGLSTVNSGKAI